MDEQNEWFRVKRVHQNCWFIIFVFNSIHGLFYLLNLSFLLYPARSIDWLRLMFVSYALHCLSGLFSCGWVRDHKRKTQRLSIIDELHGLMTSVRKETPTWPEPNWTEPRLTQFKSERSILKWAICYINQIFQSDFFFDCLVLTFTTFAYCF